MKLNGSQRLAAAVACCLGLAACGGMQKGAEEAVRENLKDPDSARFGAFYYNSKTKKACLTVNAKNSMGGYTGDQQVHLTRGDKGWSYDEEEDETQDYCKEYFADVAG